VTLQDRIIKAYYQKDGGLKTFRFTGLKPGDWKLRVSAPLYQPVEIPVTVKRGPNTLEEPVKLTGLEIPGLEKFIIFESVNNREITGELRPVAGNGEAITSHPCLDIVIFAVVSEQMKDGIFIQKPEQKGSYRGNILFQGELPRTWNRSFTAPFRYGYSLPLEGIEDTKAPYWVMDYLILVPDPVSLSPDAYKKIKEKISAAETLDRTMDLLKRYSGAVTYYFSTSWNVPGGLR